MEESNPNKKNHKEHLCRNHLLAWIFANVFANKQIFFLKKREIKESRGFSLHLQRKEPIAGGDRMLDNDSERMLTRFVSLR